MITSVALAIIFGPILVIMGIWALLYRDNMKKTLESFFQIPAILYLTGMLNLVIGLTLILSPDGGGIWLEILILLLGGVFTLRGLVILFLPKLTCKFLKVGEKRLTLFAYISIIWGLALSVLALVR